MQRPRPIEVRFGRRVEAEVAEQRFAGDGRNPVLLESRRCFRAEVEVATSSSSCMPGSTVRFLAGTGLAITHCRNATGC